MNILTNRNITTIKYGDYTLNYTQQGENITINKNTFPLPVITMLLRSLDNNIYQDNLIVEINSLTTKATNIKVKGFMGVVFYTTSGKVYYDAHHSFKDYIGVPVSENPIIHEVLYKYIHNTMDILLTSLKEANNDTILNIDKLGYSYDMNNLYRSSFTKISTIDGVVELTYHKGELTTYIDGPYNKIIGELKDLLETSSCVRSKMVIYTKCIKPYKNVDRLDLGLYATGNEDLELEVLIKHGDTTLTKSNRVSNHNVTQESISYFNFLYNTYVHSNTARK